MIFHFLTCSPSCRQNSSCTLQKDSLALNLFAIWKASTQTVENTILFSGLVGNREAPAKLTSYLRHCLPSYRSTSHQADVMSATRSLRPTGPRVTKLMSYLRHCLTALQAHVTNGRKRIEITNNMKGVFSNPILHLKALFRFLLPAADE